MKQLTPDETLLGLLAAGASHGYDLLECFRNPAQLGRVWNLSTSQLYAVLKRLESQGFTVGHEVSMPDAPTRTEYTLTDRGRERVALWLDEPCPPASVQRVRVEFLSRLYVARVLNIPTADIVRHQKEMCSAKLAELIAEREDAAIGIETLTLDLVIAQQTAILQWLDRCELVPASPLG
jgi:DNA-binding PadR family transcriptional regulator